MSSGSSDIQAAIVRLRNKDESALTDILRHYGPQAEAMLWARFGRTLLNDHDEILSDTLVRVWRFAERAGTDPRVFGAWFCRIARNIAIDMIRRKRNHPSPVVLENRELLEALVCRPAAPSEPPREDSPSRQSLRRLLSAMPESDRRILAAWAEVGGDGPWTARLAEELGISKGAVRVRRLRLVRRLTRELQDVPQMRKDDGDQENRG